MAKPIDVVLRIYGVASYTNSSWDTFDVTISFGRIINLQAIETLASFTQIEFNMPRHIFELFAQLATKITPKLAIFTKDVNDAVISIGGRVAYDDNSQKVFLIQHYHQSDTTILIGDGSAFTDMVAWSRSLIEEALNDINCTLSPVIIFPPGAYDNAMTATGITVPITTTVNVSGGGSALQDAVNAAGPNTKLLITDSLHYSPVLINGCTNLTIQSDTTAVPVIERSAPPSFPNSGPGWAMMIGGAVSGLTIRGLSFIGHGNRNATSQSSDGLIVARNDGAETPLTSLNNLIIEDCSFVEGVDSPLNGTPGILLASNSNGVSHNNVWIHRCLFDTNAAGPTATLDGYGACTVVGFGNVYIQNCSVVRNDAKVSRSNSNMRGFCFRNLSTTVENCLAWDLGTGGSCEGFKHVNSGPDFGTAIGNDTIRNCVAYNCHRGYRNNLPGTTMTISDSVYHADTVGICQFATMRTAPANLTITDSILLGAGDGQTFQNSGIIENHDDVFGFAVLGKTLDASDLTITTDFKDVINKNWTALAPATQTGASDGGAQGVRYAALGVGERIIWTYA